MTNLKILCFALALIAAAILAHSHFTWVPA